MLAHFYKAFSTLSVKDRMLYLLMLLGRSLSSALDVLGILAIGLTVSVLSSPDSTSVKTFGITLDPKTPFLLNWLAFAVLFLFLVKGILGVAFTAATTRLFIRLEISRVKSLAEGYFSSGLVTMQSVTRGETQYVLSGATQAALGGILTPFSILISELSLLIYIVATYFFVDWKIAIATLIYFVGIGAIILLITAKFQKKSIAQMINDLQQSQNVLTGMLDAFREIFVSGTSEYYVNQFISRRKGQAKYAGLMTLLGVIPRYVLEVALVVGLFVIITLHDQLLGSSASLAVLGVFLAGAMRVVASMVPLQNSINAIRGAGQEAQVSWKFQDLVMGSDSTQRVLDKELREKHIESTYDQSKPLSITARNLTYSHAETEFPSVSSIDLEVKPGKFIAVIGPSGAGKTTLVDLLLGLLQPDAGVCAINGVNSKEFIEQNPKLVAYVPQRPGMFDGSILENIALGQHANEIDIQKVQQAIKLAHLEDVIDQLPEGIYSSIGNQKDALSGGQIQRLGLARAFYQEPKLLVLDEATSALDAIAESSIIDSIASLHGKVTVIVIAHRLSTVQAADNLIVLQNGSVAGSGTFDELMISNEIVSQFVKLMNVSSEEKFN